MDQNKPHILVSNDDGINAPGIDALIMELQKIANVSVVAPSIERSAVGHAITLSDPLRVAEFKKEDRWCGYSVSGTPADCIKIAINELLDTEPDMIVSGINLGSNTGINVIYSGTVSAATEGTILGFPSFAISLTTYTNPNFAPAAKFAVKMVETLPNLALPQKTLLNINVPNVKEYQDIKGVTITRQGMSPFAEEFEKRIDLKNRAYYWLGGSKSPIKEDIEIDDRAVKERHISITPIQFDLTNYKYMESLKKKIPEISLL
ncbi:MAG: 5'/3'-nucleotidase SurE [Candidatus Marinimicrobia bacterium]|nr:5'/3'-nucleotidase SurE [Candidatus Neomarinimicrobiota bacterium]